MGSRRPPPPPEGGGAGGGGGIAGFLGSSGNLLSANRASTPVGGGASLAARFQAQDIEQVEALWKRVRSEVLDPLEHALLHFDPKATEAVRAKYYDIYTSIYQIVNDPGRDDLDRHPLIVAKHAETLTDYLQRVTLPALSEVHETYLLKAVGEQWEKYSILNNWLHKLLIFVERSYIIRQSSTPTHHHLKHHHHHAATGGGVLGLKERGIRHFSEIVFSMRSGRLGPLVTAITAIIEKRRASLVEIEWQDREACRTCLRLLQETGVTEELRANLIASAREYFAGRAAEWIVEDSVAQYMTKVEALLLQEEALMQEYELGKAIGDQTLLVGVRELIQSHGESLLLRETGGCAWLLQQRKHEELGLMYRLFKREGSLSASSIPAFASQSTMTSSLSSSSIDSNALQIDPHPPSTPPLLQPHLSYNTSSATTSADPLSDIPLHPLLDRMGVFLEEHVIALGETLQQDRILRVAQEKKLEAYDPYYIDALLKLHTDYIELTTTVLGAHSVFKSRLHAAFVHILNHQPPASAPRSSTNSNSTTTTTAAAMQHHRRRSSNRLGSISSVEEKPRLLTTACDKLLRVGGTSEEAKVTEILGLVGYLKDKDYFESCYRSEMMRRLLANRYGEGAEKAALAKLRLEHGVHFAQHSQRMLNETATSKELVQAFLKSRDAQSLRPYRLDFSVTVMAQGGWPLPATYAQFACRPPSAITSYLDHFTAFYLNLDIGRGKKLEWVLREGLLVVAATYQAKGGTPIKYELSSHPHMLFPLLVFGLDDSVVLSMSAMIDRTGITPANLEIILTELKKANLVHLRYDVSSLTTTTLRGSGYPSTSTFHHTRGSLGSSSSGLLAAAAAAAAGGKIVEIALNTNFSSKHKRMTILPKKMEEDKEKAISEDILKERNLKCQAIIVRIMKLKKTMAHRDLIVETIRQCKHFNFAPEVQFVRKVIECLIETEYLRRTPEKRDWIDYMA